jgi:hypothetical protein
MLPNHLNEFEGALYDTRDPEWSNKPLRVNYSRHHGTIETVADLKATLRGGEFAWPGGYQMFFVTSDGEALSFDTARNEFALLVDAFRTDTTWRVIGCDINYEDNELYCAHSGDKISAAYSDARGRARNR